MADYRNCEVCSWQFVPKRPLDTLCNLCKTAGTMPTAEKKRERRAARPATPLPPPRMCHGCEVEFQPRSTKAGHQRYCGSEECERERDRLRNQRSRERRKLAGMMQDADTRRRMTKAELKDYAEQALSKAHMAEVKRAFRETRSLN